MQLIDSTPSDSPPEPKVRPRAHSANATLVVMSAMYFIFYIDRVNIATAAPLIARDLRLDNWAMGLAFSAFAYPYAFFQIFGGWLGDRFGSHRTLSVAGAIVALATALTGAVSGLTTLVTARLFLGFGEGAAFPTATRAMAESLPARRWGFAQGITHACARIGNALTPPLVAFAVALVSWRLTFVGFAALGACWTIIWVVFFRGTGRAAQPAGTPSRSPGSKLAWLALARRIWPTTTVDFCYGWTLWVFLTWLPSFFFKNFHLDLKNSALFACAVLLAGVLGDVAGGFLSDTILARTGNITRARRDVIVAGLLGAAAFMIPILFVRDLTIVTICLGCAFFCAELVVAPIWSVPMDIAPNYAGTASGMMNLGFGIAGIISPLVFGAIIDATHSWTLPFVASILLLPVGAVMAFFMQPQRRFTA